MPLNYTDQSLHLAGSFLVSAGCVLLKGPLPPPSAFTASLGSSSSPAKVNLNDIKVIVLRNHRVKPGTLPTYVLPKGRAEPREPLFETAVRETTEETGYPCSLYPLPVPSSQPNVNAHANNEPLAIQMRRIVGTGQLKLIYFFAAHTTAREPGPRSEEDLDYDVLELGIEEAVGTISFDHDKEMVRLVKSLLEAKNEKL